MKKIEALFLGVEGYDYVFSTTKNILSSSTYKKKHINNIPTNKGASWIYDTPLLFQIVYKP